MPRLGIHYEQVATAAEAVLAKEQNPTVQRVRTMLGDTGSLTTINKYLNEWKAQKLMLGVQAEHNEPKPANPVSHTVDQMWEQLLEKAQKEAQKTVEQVKIDYQQRIDDLLTHNQSLEDTFQQSTEKLNDLRHEHQSLQQDYQTCQQTLDEEKTQHALAQQRIQQVQQQQTVLQQQSSVYLQEIKSAYEKNSDQLKAALQTAQQNYQEMLTDQQQQFTQEKSELETIINTQRAANEKQLEIHHQIDTELKNKMILESELRDQIKRFEQALNQQRVDYLAQNKKLLTAEKQVSELTAKASTSDSIYHHTKEQIQLLKLSLSESQQQCEELKAKLCEHATVKKQQDKAKPITVDTE